MLRHLTIIFLLISTSLSADIVKKIEIEGAERISKETIKVYGDVKLGEDYSDFNINKITKNLYLTDFFEDIKISLINSVLRITVKEYSIINSIEIKGEKSTKIKDVILEKLTLKSKGSFIENKLANDVALIKKIYGSIGFNFIKVDAKIKKFDNKQVNIIYLVEKGKKTNISKINFTGDKKVKDKRLRDVIASEEKKFWKFLSKNTSLNASNIELDKRLLVNYYKSLGYYDVQVLSNNAVVTEKNSTVLTYTVNAGTRYRITKISTNVSEVLDKKLFLPMQDSYLKIIGKYHSPFRIKKLLDTLDLLIASNDLQFIEHSVSEVIEGETIEVKINVYEGTKQSVEKIIILGNAVTDESVIRGELLLDEGDPFNKLKLDQSIAKIKSRKLFGSVEKTVIEGSSINEKIVKITVEETPTGEISAGAGIGTAGGSFAFNISENNWLGRGINVTTSLDISADTFSGGLNVTDPNYKFSGNSINYFVKNTTNDKDGSGFKNNIISTGIGTSFEQYRNLYLSPSLVYSYDDLKVNSSGSKSLQKQKGTFSDLTFVYGITFDERDRSYAPTDGYISRFNQSIPIYADAPFLKNTYMFSKYKSLSPDSIAAVKVYTSAINGLDDKDVRLSKRVTIPSSRLRGFKQVGPKDVKDYVGGNYAASTNLELSLPNLLPESTKTDIGLFLDIGNVWGVDYDKSLDDSNKIRSSAGINTSWMSPLGPMSFIFSQNITKANTDSTESFNFRLGTSF